MITWASTADAGLFPLLVHNLCNVNDVLNNSPHKELLTAEPIATISLERIIMLPDINQGGKPRTDFFVYRESGEIIRFHPTRHRAQEARAHVMSAGTPLIARGLLPQFGAGAALHMLPPGVANQEYDNVPPDVRFGADHAELINSFDAKMYGWDSARSFLDNFNFHGNREGDLSDGRGLPWWLFLGNTGKIRRVLDDGVISFRVVQLEEFDGMRAFEVRTSRTAYFVFASLNLEKKLTIREEAEMQKLIAERR